MTATSTRSIFILPKGISGSRCDRHVPEALLRKARVVEVRVPFGPRGTNPALLKIHWFYPKEDVELKVRGSDGALVMLLNTPLR